MNSKWRLVRLGEVLTPVAREERVDGVKDYRLLGVRLDGQGPFLREVVSGAQTAAGKLYRVAAGDFIYSKLFACRGAFGVIEDALDGCYASGEFPTFVPVADRLDANFLRYWFRLPSTLARVLEGSSGSTPLTRNRFNGKRLSALEIPLPPLAEQRRLVERIDELAANIKKAHALRQQAAEQVEALWKTALRAELIRQGWEEIPLEDACTEIIDNLHSNPRYTDSGVPCVRSPDVGWGTLKLETALRTDEEEYRRRTVRGAPQADDIVFVREGGGTGKAAITLKGQRFSLGQRVMMLRPDRRRVMPRFFLYQLLSPLVQEDQIGPLCKGSASPHLNIEALRRFRLRCPPLAEQHRIVAELDGFRVELDSLKNLQAKTAVELNALLPAILDRAFKGEL